MTADAKTHAKFGHFWQTMDRHAFKKSLKYVILTKFDQMTWLPWLCRNFNLFRYNYNPYNLKKPVKMAASGKIISAKLYSDRRFNLSVVLLD